MPKLLIAAGLAASTAAAMIAVPGTAHATAVRTMKLCINSPAGAATASTINASQQPTTASSGIPTNLTFTQTAAQTATGGTSCQEAQEVEPGEWIVTAVPGTAPTPGYPCCTQNLSILSWTVTANDMVGGGTGNTYTDVGPFAHVTVPAATDGTAKVTVNVG